MIIKQWGFDVPEDMILTFMTINYIEYPLYSITMFMKIHLSPFRSSPANGMGFNGSIKKENLC